MVYPELSSAPLQCLVSDTPRSLAFSAGKVVAGPAAYYLGCSEGGETQSNLVTTPVVH